ncbi:salicylate synthase [Pseudonocardia acaciae]|uniref:salicylate synthase n=1 Tax=Pseudonocardia acaciae TaxID=551276 RepID=UPI000490D408|nr:salicylate synthase [Pseudonocardia acaciae]
MATSHEVTLDGHDDPVGLAAHLAASGEFGQYVVYERDSEIILAADPSAEVVLDRDGVRVHGSAGTRRVTWTDDPLGVLGGVVGELMSPGRPMLGWATFELGYALAGQRHLLDEATLAHLMLPATVVRITGSTVWISTTGRDRLERLRELARGPIMADDRPGMAVSTDAGDPGGYRTDVRRVVESINEGALAKLILSRAVPLPLRADLPATYRRGRAGNTPARSYLLRLGDWHSAGFSPETVAEIDGDGWIVTHPLAGTRANGQGTERDSRHRDELRNDPKEIYEHAVSVKLAHDDLVPICEPGSVSVSDFMVPIERGSAQHLSSTVRGRLASGRSGWDGLAAVFPAVTCCGIPRASAMRHLRELERQPRGLYGGAVLLAEPDGALDAALVLRAIYDKDERTWLRAGAGIVAGSDPFREYEESCEKLRSVAPYVVPEAV